MKNEELKSRHKLTKIPIRNTLFVWVTFVLAFVIFSKTPVWAQKVYCYKQIKWYEESGVMHVRNGRPKYYTFTHQVAYASDEKGSSTGEPTYKYRGLTKDGDFWYCSYSNTSHPNYIYGYGLQTYYTMEWTPRMGELIVSSDFSVVNFRMLGNTFVYKRITPPSSQSDDSAPSLRK